MQLVLQTFCENVNKILAFEIFSLKIFVKIWNFLEKKGFVNCYSWSLVLSVLSCQAYLSTPICLGCPAKLSYHMSCPVSFVKTVLPRLSCPVCLVSAALLPANLSTGLLKPLFAVMFWTSGPLFPDCCSGCPVKAFLCCLGCLVPAVHSQQS